MIDVTHLTKQYGDRVALQDVSFHANRGEILGLLGPNGAGKSSTMRILTGYMPPTSGSARVAGFDVVTDSIEVRRRIGYLPENVPLYTEMTVRAYLDFVARAKQVTQREDTVEWAMDAARVDHMADSVIGRLSKGYRQRVGLAQAILADPEVLILDEPTAGLDPNQIIETRQLIKSLGRDRTVILSTHILPEVSMICDRVVIINRGQVVAEDTPDGLARRVAGTERLSITVRGPDIEIGEALRGLPGVAQVLVGAGGGGVGVSRFEIDAEGDADIREVVASTIIASGWGLREMRSQALSLEDVFLQLTTSEVVENDHPTSVPVTSADEAG